MGAESINTLKDKVRAPSLGLCAWAKGSYRGPGPSQHPGRRGGRRRSPRACGREYSGPCMEQPGRVTSGSPRPLVAFARA
ncbi:hypothetical protein NHX12_027945 [Muraenolepis orangiensis]|uniref:Uncharacterized protein n=1 Tax=Muraenolepis orangiensis TaxID=630683 RepID=A0A9Q0ED64_9TELE|nr:hypothetical protein NHX12_027945 [Muraenolepis orangiensis]